MDKFEFQRCIELTTENSRNYCFQEAAIQRKDKRLCLNITSIKDRYMCHGYVAERTQDPATCFDIPGKMTQTQIRNRTRDLRLMCYQKIRSLSPRYTTRFRTTKSIFQLDPSAGISERICKINVAPHHQISALGALEVRQCKDYYRISQGTSKSPDIIVNTEGRKVAACSQRPVGPEGVSDFGRDAKCEIECEPKNLCQGLTLDCDVLDMPAEIPKDYVSQVEYYRKKMIYDYTKATPESAKVQCDEVNRLRQKGYSQ